MPVYVDPLLPCVPNAAWRWPKSAHLFADTLAELHAFAARIGLRRAWFQVPSPDYHRLPHYDLTAAKRAQAVAHGAIELDARAAIKKWKQIFGPRHTGPTK